MEWGGGWNFEVGEGERGVIRWCFLTGNLNMFFLYMCNVFISHKQLKQSRIFTNFMGFF